MDNAFLLHLLSQCMYMEDVEQRALSPNPGGDTYTEKAVIKAFNKKYIRMYADNYQLYNMYVRIQILHGYIGMEYTHQ